jgi:hypothetical protein
VKINPLETFVRVFELIQCRFVGVEPVEVLHQPAQTIVEVTA